MDFTSSAEKYDRFMGRYTRTLAPALADAAGIEAGMRVLDVGCGPGGLTDALAARVGADHVAAIDPAPQFAASRMNASTSWASAASKRPSSHGSSSAGPTRTSTPG